MGICKIPLTIRNIVVANPAAWIVPSEICSVMKIVRKGEISPHAEIIKTSETIRIKIILLIFFGICIFMMISIWNYSNRMLPYYGIKD